MDRRAAELARREYDRAVESLNGIRAANDFVRIETHWIALLEAAGRVFTKLEQGSKVSDKSKAWWGTHVRTWKTDPLLRYVRHARNANTHTLQQIAQTKDTAVAKVQPTPQDFEALAKHMQRSHPGAPYIPLMMAEVTFAHVVVVDVTDRDVIYPVPKSHLALRVTDHTPANIGLLTIKYLEQMLSEAEKQVQP